MARNDGMKSVMRKGLLVGAIVLAAGAGWLASRAARHDGGHAVLPTVKAATVLAEGKQLPDFQLRGHGGAFSRHDLEGHWTFMFFGYTHCPDVCPLALSTGSQAFNALSAEERSRVRMLMVSVDPGRDSVTRLKEYTAFFHPEMLGVTGSDETVAQVAGAFGAAYRRQPVREDGSYAVDHTVSTYVVGPDGRLGAVLELGVPVDKIVSTVRGLL